MAAAKCLTEQIDAAITTAPAKPAKAQAMGYGPMATKEG
jgi:hypothetical protein